MSIDHVVKDKIQALLEKTKNLKSLEEADPYCEQMEDLFEWCKDNYPTLCEYIEGMQDNLVKDGNYHIVLDKYKMESQELRDNIKLIIELCLSIPEGPDAQNQKDWLDELKKADGC
jgi:hypothetical protein